MPILRVAADPGRSQSQVARLFAIGRDHGLEADDVRQLVDQTMGTPGSDPRGLTRAQYDDLCNDVIPGMEIDRAAFAAYHSDRGEPCPDFGDDLDPWPTGEVA